MDIHMGAGQRMILDTAAQARFQNFLKTYHGKKLVVLELGIGWRNQLIKAPMMRLVASEPNATYRHRKNLWTVCGRGVFRF